MKPAAEFNPIKKAEEIAKSLVDFVKELEARHAMSRNSENPKKLLRRGTIEIFDLGERGEFMASYRDDERKLDINGIPVPTKPKKINAIGITPYNAMESLAAGMVAEKVLG